MKRVSISEDSGVPVTLDWPCVKSLPLIQCLLCTHIGKYTEGASLIHLRDKFFTIKMLGRKMMICGGSLCSGWRVVPLVLFPAPLAPGVSVASITNETCVINPCNGVHEFTPEQRLEQPACSIKPGMYSFHVLC